MMLIICDKNPVRAAELVPDRLKDSELPIDAAVAEYNKYMEWNNDR